MRNFKGMLSGNQLKITALAAMTCDHVGKQFFADAVWLTVIGRLAFPVFAYMIAEGCRYTKNRKRYLGNMLLLAAVCQLAFGIAEKSLYQCVLVTFSLSVVLIYIADNAVKKRSFKGWCYLSAGLLAVYFVTEILPVLLKGTDYYVDYGFWGVMLPVLVFMTEGRWGKLVSAGCALVMISAATGGVQWFSLLSIPVLALYNGKKGRLNIKNLFYVYYPAHLAGIYLISMILY